MDTIKGSFPFVDMTQDPASRAAPLHLVEAIDWQLTPHVVDLIDKGSKPMVFDGAEGRVVCSFRGALDLGDPAPALPGPPPALHISFDVPAGQGLVLAAHVAVGRGLGGPVFLADHFLGHVVLACCQSILAPESLTTLAQWSRSSRKK